MAKIIFHKSVLNLEDKIEIEKSDVSLMSILKELEIETNSLSIQVNGETPDDINAEMILKESDEIIIKKVVHGDSGTKRTLATVINIAAVVGALFIDPTGSTSLMLLKAGLVIGGSIASGALFARAAQLDAQSLVGGGFNPEISVATNSYSQTNINNQARAMQPVPIVMGSHKVVPDLYARPFKWLFGFQNEFGENEPFLSSFYTGITSGNGVDKTSWVSISKGFVETKTDSSNNHFKLFPQYDIQISPYFFGVTGNISSGEQTTIRNQFKSTILTAWAAAGTFGSADHVSNIDYNHYFGNTSAGCTPMVIYHSDVTDPNYGKYGLLFPIIRAYELNRARKVYLGGSETTDYYASVAHFFAGTFTTVSAGISLQQRFFRFPNETTGINDIADVATHPVNIPLLKVGSVGGKYYPSTIDGHERIGNLMTEVHDLILAANGGNYANSKTVSYSIEKQIIIFGVTSIVKEGIDCSTQLFNFGLGDLVISERKIGSTILETGGNVAAYSPINKTNWKIPTIVFPALVPISLDFFSYLNTADEKKLFNVNSPDDFIDTTDLNQYNFVNYEGGINQETMLFVIQGRLYATNTATGFNPNTCVLELQYKFSSDIAWRIFDFGFLSFENDNTKVFSLPMSIGDLDMPDGDRLQVRIRKVTLDADNNDGENVCDLYIRKVNFMSFQETDQELKNRHIPQNIDGVFMTSLLTDATETNRYAAMVNAKCFYYNFETEAWVWGETRNPAFWFLYFAKGGYQNEDVDWNLNTYPNSPTQGWQNNAANSLNTAHLFGGGYVDSQIDMEQILLWAQFCEDNELFFDLVLTDDTSCADVLERIANAGRGSVTQYNSKLSVVFEDADQVPTCMFGMGNIRAGTFEVNYAVADPIRKVICNYVDRTTWDTKTVEAVVPFSDSDNLKDITLNLEGITDASRAQREANLLASRQFFQRRTYNWEVDIEGMLAKRGDLVYLSHDSTQYGISGRIVQFIFENDSIIGIKSQAILNQTIEYVTIRFPNGLMQTYECEVQGDSIIFNEPYDISKAPYYITLDKLNKESDFRRSYAEDFIFIAGEKPTTGKVVRISTIESLNDFYFKINAVDEDPAMWAYEFEPIDEEDLESFDDAEVELIVENVSVEHLGNGAVKILWNGKNCDLVQIINTANNLPIEANGSYTFSNGEAIISLTVGTKFTLEVKPFAIGTAYFSRSKNVTLWPT